MSQLFSNNVDTTLADALSDVATSATLTDGSGLNAPTGGRYELLAIAAGGNIEIVRMTARSGNTATITRAQEGTTTRNWSSGARVFAGVTAGTLERFLFNRASGAGAFAIGPDSFADQASDFAAGPDAYANGGSATAIGKTAGAYGAGSFAGGDTAYVDGAGGIGIGRNSQSMKAGAIAFGDGANADGADSIAIGGTWVFVPRTLQFAALPAVSRNNNSYTEAVAAWKMSGAQSVIMSEPLDLKTLQTHTIPLPTGVTFFPEEVGVIITAASGVTGQPTLRFAITGTEAKFLAATATTGLDAVHERERFATLLSSDGAKTLRAEVTVAATGTTLTGRVYWKGFAVVDS